MPRIGLVNFVIGFVVLFLAASAGALVAMDMTDSFLSAPERLTSWQMTLHKTSHGHTNLFAMIHIALGLTLPYSKFTERTKILQTIGLFAGTLAMGPLMYIRAGMGPSASVDFWTILTGVLLSAALAAIGTHAAGLGAKLLRV